MKASSVNVGLSLALAGFLSPVVALAQPNPTPPAGPPPAAAPPAEAAPAPAPAPEPAPAPAPAPVVVAPPPAAEDGKQPPPPPAAAPEAPPAEETAPASTVSGLVEAGFDMNLSKNSFDAPAPLRAYDAVGGFKLRNANLKVSHQFSDQASAFVSVDFGTDASYNNVNYFGVYAPGADGTVAKLPSTIPVDIREGYAKWTPGDFTFTGGKFVTTMGIEVVDGPANPTISRGYLYWLAEPVGHTGFKGLYSIAGGMAHVGFGVVNGWDRLLDNNNKKTLIFNADVAPSEIFHVQLSGAYGAEQDNNDDDSRLTLDLTGAFVFDSLTLNFQGLYGSEQRGSADSDNWYGLGVQPLFVADIFSLGGRIEYFHNKFGSRTGLAGEDQGLLNFTITPGISPAKGLLLRAEYRIDAMLALTDPSTGDSKDVLNGKSTQSTISLGMSYMF